jgi:hypothetical protein
MMAHGGLPHICGELIHRSAWKKSNSRKFAVANGSSTDRQALENRLCGTPLGSKRGNLVAVVAPLRIKGLRLVTVQPPEKFLVPSGPLSTSLQEGRLLAGFCALVRAYY